jgi:hypothetical protein
MSADRHEDRILQLHPAPAAPAFRMVWLGKDVDGFWQATSEPVALLALVERTWYVRPLADLPGDPRARRRFIRERERRVEAMAHDLNTATAFTMACEAENSDDEVVSVLAADADWETVIGAITVAQSAIFGRSRQRAKVGARA